MRPSVGTRADVGWKGGPLWASFSPSVRISPHEHVERIGIGVGDEGRPQGSPPRINPTRVPTFGR
jgi:hypothetical protein